MFLSCNEPNHAHLVGTYLSEDKIVLQLKENAKYVLDNSSTSIKIEGTYKLRRDKLICKILKTEYQPYTIERLPQSNISGLEFIIKGKNWKELSNVNCKIKQNGKITQEGYTDKQGKVRFDFVANGKLIAQPVFGWEEIEIDLDKLSARSIIITVEREKFKEDIKQLEFEVHEDTLIGLKKISHWKLQKK